MKAVEFQTKVKHGVNEIPKAYQTRLGERTQIMVIILKQQRQEHVQGFKALLKETQALPQAQTITEIEIAAEIHACRLSSKNN